MIIQSTIRKHINRGLCTKCKSIVWVDHIAVRGNKPRDAYHRSRFMRLICALINAVISGAINLWIKLVWKILVAGIAVKPVTWISSK